MLAGTLARYDGLTARLSGPLPEGLILAFVRLVLAGVFWRSGRTKVTEGSWFEISDTTFELFRTEYAGVPLPADLSAIMATSAEHLLPALLIAGLFTLLLRLGIFLFALLLALLLFVLRIVLRVGVFLRKLL